MWPGAMKVFKPLQLSLQFKSYSWQNKNQLAVSLLLGFPFDHQQEVLLEQDLWKFLPTQLPQDAVLDHCMPKANGEVLVFGNYHSPGGQPVSADEVQIKFGPVNKTLAVIGNRYWRTLLAPTNPEPFTDMPISYEYAFGGKDYKPNPTGKGMEEVDVLGEMRLPMPNLENPDKLVTSPDQRPNPAGLGPLDMMWEQRAVKAGTYDEAWQRDYFPGYPLDIDWTYFNTAPEDQWNDGFWNGDERFELLNLHPEKPQIEGRLPAFRTRCFIDKKHGQGFKFSEVEMRAETVCLFPEAETGVLIYRGAVEVKEDDATDVEYLMVAYEDMDQPPRTAAYYEEAFRNRLDEKQSFKFLMYTQDIIPDSERCGFARLLGGEVQFEEGAFAQNMDAKAESEKQKGVELLEQQKKQLQESLAENGIDPAPYLEKFEQSNKPVDDPRVKELMELLEKTLPGSTSGNAKNIQPQEVDFAKLDELILKMDEMAAAGKDQARQQLENVLEKLEGTDGEQQARQQIEAAIKQIDEPPLLPRPIDTATLEAMKSQLDSVKSSNQQNASLDEKNSVADINLVEIEQKIQDSMAQTKEMYLSAAHFISGKPPHQLPLDIVKHRLVKSLEKGESISGRDLSGVDLSSMDFSNMDLCGCYLEYANLSYANFSGAKLDRAIITHANLTKANFSGASLVEANLGGSKLRGTDLTGANTQGAEFSKADLEGAKIIGCDLEGANFLETRFVGADLSSSNLTGANFVELEFLGAKFTGCNLTSCNFIKGQMRDLDFSNAIIVSANFVECDCDNANFMQANMTNVRFVGGCLLRHCNFERAILDKANLRETNAEYSNFEHCSFYMADFSEANLQHTSFYAAVGKRAIFMKSDLMGADFSSVNMMEGSLMKARLTNTDLRYSNLYAVEFLSATVGGTDFFGANLDLSKLQDWSPPK